MNISNKDNKDNKDEVIMYLFVNNDLGMRKGKIASQVGHCVQKIVEEILLSDNISNGVPDRIKKYYKDWNSDLYAKIVLKASYSELKQLQTYPYSVSIYDAGRTQIPENSLTVVGFYPCPKKDMKNITSSFKLL